ncbi:MAG TPA: alpha/beta hydrolase, partial [Myxococcales bacterium]|nr:alpha/beta hydrolase [Myxococcales bacterium]
MQEIQLRFEGRAARLRAEGRAGPTVLFAHPFPLDGSCWEDLMRDCAALGWRAIAVDCPGFGGTPPLGQPCTMDDLARLFAAALDALGARTATLVGCSMGGYAMMAFWRLFPERMDRAALLCTQPGADPPEAKERREQQARAALEKGPEAVTAPLAERALAPRSPLVERARALARGATAQGIADALRGMALRPDSTPDLPRWRARTLVVRGEQDQIIPPTAAETMARSIPGARLSVIAGGGHLAFLEKP